MEIIDFGFCRLSIIFYLAGTDVVRTHVLIVTVEKIYTCTEDKIKHIRNETAITVKN